MRNEPSRIQIMYLKAIQKVQREKENISIN